MSEEDEECPLCMEPIEEADRSFHPCPCGYQICMFCYNRLKEEENFSCPACRRKYREEDIQYKPPSPEQLQARRKKKKEHKESKAKDVFIDPARRKQLENVKLIQRNLVFVSGLLEKLSDEKPIRAFFGRYGEILRVHIVRQFSGNKGAAAYITFANDNDARACIIETDMRRIDGVQLRAMLGLTRYCQSFLNNQPCLKESCTYTHQIADDACTFTLEEIADGKHYEVFGTRTLIQQVAATQQQKLQSQQQPLLDQRKSVHISGPANPTQANSSIVVTNNGDAHRTDGVATESNGDKEISTRKHQEPKDAWDDDTDDADSHSDLNDFDHRNQSDALNSLELHSNSTVENHIEERNNLDEPPADSNVFTVVSNLPVQVSRATRPPPGFEGVFSISAVPPATTATTINAPQLPIDLATSASDTHAVSNESDQVEDAQHELLANSLVSTSDDVSDIASLLLAEVDRRHEQNALGDETDLNDVIIELISSSLTNSEPIRPTVQSAVVQTTSSSVVSDVTFDEDESIADLLQTPTLSQQIQTTVLQSLSPQLSQFESEPEPVQQQPQVAFVQPVTPSKPTAFLQQDIAEEEDDDDDMFSIGKPVALTSFTPAVVPAISAYAAIPAPARFPQLPAPSTPVIPTPATPPASVVWEVDLNVQAMAAELIGRGRGRGTNPIGRGVKLTAAAPPTPPTSTRGSLPSRGRGRGDTFRSDRFSSEQIHQASQFYQPDLYYEEGASGEYSQADEEKLFRSGSTPSSKPVSRTVSDEIWADVDEEQKPVPQIPGITTMTDLSSMAMSARRNSTVVMFQPQQQPVQPAAPIIKPVNTQPKPFVEPPQSKPSTTVVKPATSFKSNEHLPLRPEKAVSANRYHYDCQFCKQQFNTSVLLELHTSLKHSPNNPANQASVTPPVHRSVPPPASSSSSNSHSLSSLHTQKQTQPDTAPYHSHKVCLFFNVSTCKKGSSCPYRHVIDEEMQAEFRANSANDALAKRKNKAT